VHVNEGLTAVLAPATVVTRLSISRGEAEARPVWTDSTSSHVIAFLLLSEKGVKTSATDKFGLVADGHFTPLPKLVVGIGDAVNQGGLAF